MNIGGTDTDEMAGAKITEYVHSRHGLRYNTGKLNTGKVDIKEAGKEKFTVIIWTLESIVKFKLMSYINKTDGNIVNCYDQASAVQSLCGAIGITTHWLFCEPFGYINTTNLVGIRKCNNPFYPINGSKPVVPRNDPDRIPFGNHAFCGIVINKQDNVLDGCAGPHTGDESRKEYLDKSIDRAMGDDGHVSDIEIYNEVNTIE